MVKLRVSQILDKRQMTAYGLAKASDGRISLSAAYRLAKDEWDHIPRDVLEALCEVLEVTPGELFEYKPKRGKT